MEAFCLYHHPFKNLLNLRTEYDISREASEDLLAIFRWNQYYTMSRCQHLPFHLSSGELSLEKIASGAASRFREVGIPANATVLSGGESRVET